MTPTSAPARGPNAHTPAAIIAGAIGVAIVIGAFWFAARDAGPPGACAPSAAIMYSADRVFSCSPGSTASVADINGRPILTCTCPVAPSAPDGGGR